MPKALPVQDLGHFAVVCFFVLSGYVISYVSDTRERSGTAYLVSRAARVYSVALPAIILTLVCDFVGRNLMGHPIYALYPNTSPLVRIIASLTFVNELWFQSIVLFSNGPYWSLCYEVWYYAIFGAAVYLRGRARTITVTVLLALAGPNILLLFPVWLLGVALYHYKRVLSFSAGFFVFLASMAGLIGMAESEVRWVIEGGLRSLMGYQAWDRLGYSADFPTDYVFAALVAANFLAVRSFEGKIHLAWWMTAAIRWAAASTFSLYLFHRPLLVFLMSTLALPPTFWNALILTILTVTLAVLLSYATERRKSFWRRAVSFLLSAVRGKSAGQLA
jgi:peptidoglycan/LPS O-acetylase OafA/YrhL